MAVMGPLQVAQFKGGQSNPTYRLDAASGTYVLRRKPPGALLASAHAVDREFRVLQALQGRVPVATPRSPVPVESLSPWTSSVPAASLPLSELSLGPSRSLPRPAGWVGAVSAPMMLL
jgi:hypothetical protein